MQDYEEIKRFDKSLFSFNIELVFDFTTGLLVDWQFDQWIFLLLNYGKCKVCGPALFYQKKEKRKKDWIF